MIEEKPCLRPVEAFPINAGTHRMVCLRDPMNISQRIIGVPSRALYIISLMDGSRTIQEIQNEYLKRYHEILPTDDLEKLISDLDESLMLDSQNFRKHLADLERNYVEAPFRVPTHLGAPDEQDPEQMAARIDSFFVDPEGPGEPLSKLRNGGSGKRKGSKKKAPTLAGLISPHIDYGRGGPTYAWAYRELLRGAPADLYIVLGTSHVPLSQPFSVSRKHFGTPFGTLETDTDFISLLEESVGRPLESDPLVHRGEHSIELQSVWLKYLLGSHDVKIAPILCGSLGMLVEEGASPRDDQSVRGFIDGLRQAIERSGRRVVLIAAGDLAHIGTGFGDVAPPDSQLLSWVEEHDLGSLKAATDLDAMAFYRSIEEEKDRRRICGLSPIYAMLEVLEADKGELLKYRQCIDPNGFRTVTIASAAFYK